MNMNLFSIFLEKGKVNIMNDIERIKINYYFFLGILLVFSFFGFFLTEIGEDIITLVVPFIFICLLIFIYDVTQWVFSNP